MTRPLSRRAVLRGAGAMVGLPFLESLGHAVGAADPVRPPVRLGIYTVTGGTVLESWKLPSPGPLAKLPSILRPLEFAREDLLLLTGLSQSGQAEGLNAHEHCGYLHLTCADLVKKEGGKPVAGISVDQAAAQAVGARTFLPSLEIGLSNHETKYSFHGPETPVPYEADPRVLFARMFRGRQPVVPNWSRRAAPARAASKPAAPSYDRSVVDLILEDAKDLRGRLSRGDQQKLDEYVQSVRSIEKRIDFLDARLQEELADAAAPGPSRLVRPELPDPKTPVWQIQDAVHRDPEKHGEYLRIMADLMVLAFQTDTTRVVTLAAGSDEALFPGVVTVGYERHCHTLEHQGNAGRVEEADPIAREACRQIHAWYTQFFAEMVRKMKAIDEGGTSLLDNSLILYTSYMADGGHGRDDYPVVLAGRAGGTLRPGRQVSYRERTPVANLYVEVLNRVGARVESFGNSRTSPHAQYGGRLPDLG